MGVLYAIQKIKTLFIKSIRDTIRQRMFSLARKKGYEIPSTRPTGYEAIAKSTNGRGSGALHKAEEALEWLHPVEEAIDKINTTKASFPWLALTPARNNQACD